MASARFEEGKAYRLTDYAWGWSYELVCVKRNAKSIRFHDTDGEAYTFKLQHDEWDNEEVKCGEGFGHNWLSAKDVIEEDIIRIRGRETAQPEATTTATPSQHLIHKKIFLSFAQLYYHEDFMVTDNYGKQPMVCDDNGMTVIWNTQPTLPDNPLLMNPFTGSVAPESEWRKDYEYMMQQEDGDCLWGGKEFDDAGLVEVRRNENGDWVRV